MTGNSRNNLFNRLLAHVALSTDLSIAQSHGNKTQSLCLYICELVECRKKRFFMTRGGFVHPLLHSSGTTVSDSQIQSEPKKWARFTADAFQVTVLLKGNISYVASKDREIELPSGSPWLATAGTGDVLAGNIGALVATHSREIAQLPDFLSGIAATGSFIHAKAAQIASDGGPITAMGVAHAIPKVMSDLLHKGM